MCPVKNDNEIMHMAVSHSLVCDLIIMITHMIRKIPIIPLQITSSRQA